MIVSNYCQTLKQSYLLLFRFIWFSYLLQREYRSIRQDAQRELVGLCCCLLSVWICHSKEGLLKQAVHKLMNAKCLIAILHDEQQLNVAQHAYLQGKVDYISAQLCMSTKY